MGGELSATVGPGSGPHRVMEPRSGHGDARADRPGDLEPRDLREDARADCRKPETKRVPLIEFPAATLEWNRLFALERPVQVEVGAGKGRFLIRSAQNDPASNWVGLETRWGTLRLGVERTLKRRLDNALFVRCDATEIVYTMNGTAASGNPAVVIVEPAPNSD